MRDATIANSASLKPPTAGGALLLATTVSEKPWVFTSVVAVAALAVCLGVSFWGLNKGLDLEVEGFYLLSYQRPEQYTYFSSFPLLLAKIPHLVSNEIVHYRLLEMAARIIPAILLSLGFGAWCRFELPLSRSKICLAAAFSCIGAAIAFSVFPRSISYNGLSAAFVYTSIALAFMGTVRHISNQFRFDVEVRSTGSPDYVRVLRRVDNLRQDNQRNHALAYLAAVRTNAAKTHSGQHAASARRRARFFNILPALRESAPLVEYLAGRHPANVFSGQ